MEKQKTTKTDVVPVRPLNGGDETKAEMLLSIAQTMAAFETLDEMLEALVEIVKEGVNAQRGTIYLHDKETGELYSRVATGKVRREIRISTESGVAGHVFSTGKGTIVHDARQDKHFDRSVDESTGFVTKSLLTAPIKTVKGEIIGAAQALNKKKGRFTKRDLELLESMTTQAAVALQTIQFVEKIKKSREQEMEFFDVVADVISEIDLGTILQKVMAQATKMLNAERSTLFLNDEKTDELFSQVGEGLGAAQIRLPNHAGIAGAVFTSGKTINIPHAYADLRFNPAFDKKTGFFTRSILCVPVVNKTGKTIGVTQVLNKRGGAFSDEDEFRLRAFTGQIAIALENAKLFNDVQKEKIYSEGMLESMTNGVITINEDGRIITCNKAGSRIMKLRPDDIIEHMSADFFTKENAWILDKIKQVEKTQQSEVAMDAEINLGRIARTEEIPPLERAVDGDAETAEKKVSVNLTVLPLTSIEDEKLGSMLILEDLSKEKRMKSDISRYMNPEIAEQLIQHGTAALDGKSGVVTCLFSDIRGFTTLTEELGAKRTVQFLNEYFDKMVNCIQKQEGMVDKFIGDAIMAGFGVPPFEYDDDADRGVGAAIAMIQELFAWNAGLLEDNQNEKPVDMGIGLNTDTVVSGNIGSEKRKDYTMIGDGVNLAARLESACKQYHTRILISEYTYAKLDRRKRKYCIREIDRVVVKGKTEPVSIHEVLDYYPETLHPALADIIKIFAKGVSYYRFQKWDDAAEHFKKSAAKWEEALKPYTTEAGADEGGMSQIHRLLLASKDKLSEMYIRRCTHYKADPPGEEWDGVWVMTSK